MGDVKFDLIDAHYFYPDGVAAARLAEELDMPLLITGRGTDLTLIPQSPPERAQIQWAGEQASALITVCEDLKDRLIELGEPASRIVTLRNGVDLRRFALGDREAARAPSGSFRLHPAVGGKPHSRARVMNSSSRRSPICRMRNC